MENINFCNMLFIVFEYSGADTAIKFNQKIMIVELRNVHKDIK